MTFKVGEFIKITDKVSKNTLYLKVIKTSRYQYKAWSYKFKKILTFNNKDLEKFGEKTTEDEIILFTD